MLKMFAGEDGGGWNSCYSNVVCVRTKSSKETENSKDDVPVVNIHPTVLRSVYGGGSLAIPPSQPWAQRRRTVRLSYNPPPTISFYSSPTRYEGVGKVLIGPKTPVRNSFVSDLDFSHLSLSRPRRSTAVVTSLEPKLFVDLPEVTTLPRTSALNYFRPVRLLPVVRWSISPLTWLTRYSTRSSLPIPTYSAPIASVSSTGSRTIYTGSVTPKPSLGNLDVSYLFKIPYLHKGTYSGISSAPGPYAWSAHRSGSWPAIGAYRPTHRASTEWQPAEEFRRVLLPSSSSSSVAGDDIFSTLRYRTERARDMLNTHRSLIAKYLPESGIQVSSSSSSIYYSPIRRDTSFEHVSYSPHPNILSLSRVISAENRDITSASRNLPWVPEMSETRRRIRNFLYMASGDQGYRS